MDKVKPPFLLKKGAEANLYLVKWHGRKVVIKERLPKKYRPSELDERIRSFRTVHEPQLMHEAKRAGVPTPAILMIDTENAAIYMEFIEGTQVKRLLGQVNKEERLHLCLTIGELIAKLHANGIIHGDLTTSNMILSSAGKVVFVDFGLGERSSELEAQGVDLHLMKRALESAHFMFAEDCFDAVIKGYSSVVGAESVRNVLDKIREIERRGRYVADRRKEME